MGALHRFLTSDDARLLTRGADRALSELVLQAIHLQLEGTPIEKLAHGFKGVERFRALQPERVAKIADIFRLPEAS
jgi:hypothetical protein